MVDKCCAMLEDGCWLFDGGRSLFDPRYRTLEAPAAFARLSGPLKFAAILIPSIWRKPIAVNLSSIEGIGHLNAPTGLNKSAQGQARASRDATLGGKRLHDNTLKGLHNDGT
ncbi:MAG: hypothetical protein WAW37_11270 [Syntrophobacteraceae bacterium]